MGLELRIALPGLVALAAASALAGATPPVTPPAAPPAEAMPAPPAIEAHEPAAAPAMQGMPGMEGHDAHGAHGTPGAPGSEAMPGMPGMEGHEAHGHHAMPALLGPYGATREASGTSWQPESAPHEALMARRGPWWLALHGQALVAYDRQEGERGASKWFSSNFLMGMATRTWGPGRLGLRAMVSLEPWTIGRNGYPLLLQTGETGNGVTELVDRQHPHDLFSELAATYSIPAGRASSVFLYVGLPGEPALGPPTYMHRFSAMDNPETPLSHHWLDSTHVSFGVATVGWIMSGLKVESSVFRGREPDQHRADVESPSLDSYSFRISYQPDPGLVVQGSFGHLKGPEQLAPGVDVNRSTVSVTYNVPLAENGNLQTTLAWGRNQRRPGRTTNAYLFEGTAAFLSRHTVFFRVEQLENDELVGDVLNLRHKDALLVAERTVPPVAVVTKLGGGYVYDLLVGERYRAGAGFDLSVNHVPKRLESSYGGDWVPGWMLFLRFRLGGSAM
jgi:hypothetical protein